MEMENMTKEKQIVNSVLFFHTRSIWVEFDVGFRSCSECFSLGSPFFFPLQKTKTPNSSSFLYVFQAITRPYKHARNLIKFCHYLFYFIHRFNTLWPNFGAK